MIVLGLTGSIGMGKTTLAGMMLDLKIPVHDADACVHELLSPEGGGHYAVAAAFPYYDHPQIYDRKTKSINRKELGALVFADDAKRQLLESILHPLVEVEQKSFLSHWKKRKLKFVCLDIPLLFETNGKDKVDYTLVVSAPSFIQRARVMSRPGMTEQKFEAILSRQMPDIEKRQRADYVIHTGLGLAQSRKELKLALRDIEKKEFPQKNPPLKEKMEKIRDPRNRPRY